MAPSRLSLPNSFDVSFDSEAEKIRIADNCHTDSVAPSRLSVPNALDFLTTPGSEAEKYPASGKPETGSVAPSRLVGLAGFEPTG